MTYLAQVASLPYGPLYNEKIHITCKQTNNNIYICTNRYNIPKTSSNEFKNLKIYHCYKNNNYFTSCPFHWAYKIVIQFIKRL